jgi:hypothetical protein
MQWSADEVALLRRLARSGISYSEMGSHLGRTKYSIYRKARDLGLMPPRPVPSGFQADRRVDHGRTGGKSYVKKRAGKTTLPPLSSLQET